jgi:hypothetical protein
MVFMALVCGVLSGAALTPLFLSRLPGKAFSVKGASAGFIMAACLALALWQKTSGLELLGLALLVMAISSFMAMNFTGSTPFTSPTGVEKEMRRAIPLQAAASLAAVIAWIGSGFSG